MKRVIQEDPTGCGIACVAMLANKSYSEVRETFVSRVRTEKSRNLLTEASDLRKLGAFYDLSFGKRIRKFKNLNSLPEIAILGINFHQEDETWHWVVYHRTDKEEYVLDPKKSIKSEKRRDFNRISKKSKWFLPVE